MGLAPPADLPLVSEDRIEALYDAQSDAEAIRRAAEVARMQQEAVAKFRKTALRNAIIGSIVFGAAFAWWATAWQDNQLKFLLVSVVAWVTILHLLMYQGLKALFGLALKAPNLSPGQRQQLHDRLPGLLAQMRTSLLWSALSKVVEVWAVAALVLLFSAYLTSDLGSVELALRGLVSSIANFYYGEQTPEMQLLAQVTTFGLIFAVGAVSNKASNIAFQLPALSR